MGFRDRPACSERPLSISSGPRPSETANPFGDICKLKSIATRSNPLAIQELIQRPEPVLMSRLLHTPGFASDGKSVSVAAPSGANTKAPLGSGCNYNKHLLIDEYQTPCIGRFSQFRRALFGLRLEHAVLFLLYSQRGRVAELADAADSKSAGA
jgi:hypothetical protein